MAINFISSKEDSDETRTMRTKDDNIEIMMGSETDEIIEVLFKSLFQRYQEGLEESMRGSGFIFDCLDALYYNLNKISLSRGGSYIDSPKWIKNKNATVNPKNNDDKCFQYTLTYKSKYNLNCENQVILLMITDGEKWHYLAVKSLSALFRGITSNNNGDLYCLNCFHSFRTENKLKKHKKVCENHDYCYVEMPKEDNKILKYNHGEKSMRVPFIIYADLEFLL